MHRLRTTTAAAVAAGLLAGCGGASAVAEDPQRALTEAVRRAAAWDGATATIRFDFDEDRFVAAADLDEENARIARTLARSTLRVAAHPGSDPDDAADDVSHVALEVDGIAAFEFRAIREDLYLRADVRALIDEFADDPETRAEVDRTLAEVTDAAEAFGIDVLDQALDGAWVRLQGHQQLTAMFTGMAEASGMAPDALAYAELAEQAAAAVTALVEDVEVAYVAADAVGDHLQVTTTGRQLSEAVRPLVDRYLQMAADAVGGGPAGDLPALDDLETDPDAQRLLDTTIPVEVWVADGELAQVGFDIVQLFRLNPGLAGDGEAAAGFDGLDRWLLAIAVAPFGGELEAPADAVTVDLFDLFGRAMAGGYAAP